MPFTHYSTRLIRPDLAGIKLIKDARARVYALGQVHDSTLTLASLGSLRSCNGYYCNPHMCICANPKSSLEIEQCLH